MARSDTLLRGLSRLLPREFRERVFEPALVDLQLEERCSHVSRWARWAARTILAAESMRLGIPQLAWRRGRLTRLAAAVLVVLVVLVVTALAIQPAGYAERRVDHVSAR
jgi:hypothetical protein